MTINRLQEIITFITIRDVVAKGILARFTCISYSIGDLFTLIIITMTLLSLYAFKAFLLNENHSYKK
jgi:hypothetical protein